MNITVSKNELLSKLKLVGKIIQPNKTNPELDNFLFKIDSDKLSVTGADEQGSITTTIECTIDPEGGTLNQFTANAKTLLDALKELSEQPLTFKLSVKDMYVEITAQYINGKFEIVGGKGDLFPTVNPTGDPLQIPMSSMQFTHGLKRTYFRAADDELRPVMNGVYIDQQEEVLTFVGSDGSTLAMMEYISNNQNRCSFILPSKIAKILVDIIPADEDNFSIHVFSKHVQFVHSGFTILYRMIEGKYPNYRSVIPSSNNLICRGSKLDVIAALKRVSIFCNRNTSLLKVTLFNNKMMLAAQDLDYSISADEEIPVEYTSEKVSIGFKATFLLDILSNLPYDEFTLHIADPSRAALIKGAEQSDSENLTYLIMPLMLNY
ncbi:DNA polymerase III subunit beta [Bacteroides sp. 51]|uniref:DNA polymerase III subunit beta n=1 Tax=Bacteroides sp. 51 TaxID=2302938 RepID=UPI0013D7D22F|nr:DNA polymerase III subunit beta [Bacteroides sp. 51]NDV81360.1 DNA polymerase III subunit beta [Bacteroides sp. 51]